MTAPVTRRRREVITKSDGSEYRIPKPPRADVLHYPAYDVTTILVRRTHDPELARAMAEDRWAELLAVHLVEGELGYEDRCVRVGWWTTVAGRQKHPTQAIDLRGRVVTPCTDLTGAAGPGIEFRP